MSFILLRRPITLKNPSPPPLTAIEVSRDGARQGMVMLKNENARLPLGAPASYARTVVIGPTEDLNDVTGYCEWLAAWLQGN